MSLDSKNRGSAASWAILPLEIRQNIVSHVFDTIASDEAPRYGVVFRRTLVALTSINQAFSRDDLLRPLTLFHAKITRRYGEWVRSERYKATKSRVSFVNPDYHPDVEQCEWDHYGECSVYNGIYFQAPLQLMMHQTREVLLDLEGQLVGEVERRQSVCANTSKDQFMANCSCYWATGSIRPTRLDFRYDI